MQAPKATSQKAVAADDEDMDPTVYTIILCNADRYVCMYVHLLTYISIYLSLSIFLSIHLSIYVRICAVGHASAGVVTKQWCWLGCGMTRNLMYVCVYEQGWTCLFHASDGGHVHMAEWLLQQLGLPHRVALACGSGACAAVVVLARQGRVDAIGGVEVALPGGTLRIRAAGDGNILMGGPAAFVFEGTWQ